MFSKDNFSLGKKKKKHLKSSFPAKATNSPSALRSGQTKNANVEWKGNQMPRESDECQTTAGESSGMMGDN